MRRFIKSIIAIALAMVMLAQLFPAIVYAEDAIGTVKINAGSNAKVRDRASFDGKNVGEAKAGKEYDLLENTGEWYKIRLDANTVGWIYNTTATVVEKTAGSGEAQAEQAQTKDAASHEVEKTIPTLKVTTNQDYNKSLCIYQDDLITMYLRKVSLNKETGAMSVSIYCDVDPQKMPIITGYSANGELSSLKIGGVSTQLTGYQSTGLRGSLDERTLSYNFQNPDSKPVEMVINLKNSRFNGNRFNYNIGPITIEFEGDLYDGVGDLKAEQTEETVSLGALLHGQSVTLVDQNGITIKAISISYAKEGRYGGPEITLTLSVSNANVRPVYIDLETAVKVDNTIYYGIFLNGKQFSYFVRDMSNFFDDLGISIPAGVEDHRYRLIITEDDSPVPTLEELETGFFAIVAYMPTTDALAQQRYFTWPQLFNIEPFMFDLKFDESLIAQEEVLEGVCFEMVSVEDLLGATIADTNELSLWCFSAELDSTQYPALFSAILAIENKTDHEVTVRAENVKLDGESVGGMIGVSGDRSIVAGSGDDMFAHIFFYDDSYKNMKQLTCTLCLYDAATEEKLVEQPITINRVQGE